MVPVPGPDFDSTFSYNNINYFKISNENTFKDKQRYAPKSYFLITLILVITQGLRKLSQ